MRIVLSIAGAIVLGCAVGFAQTTSGSPTEPRPTTQTSTGEGRQPGQVTLIGCLQDGSAGGSAAGSSSTSADPRGEYTLMNARRGEAGSRNRSSTAETPPSGSSSGASTGARERGDASSSARTDAQTYRLQGTDLARHVGHQVEVMGTLSGPGGTSSSSQTSTGSTGSDGTSRGLGAAAASQTLVVSSVRMIATSCER
jgi:hypothetical protein